MNVKILTLVIVLLVSLLRSAGAPMASVEHGREVEEAPTVRKMVQQSPARGGQPHRPAGWKRRRPRPRLSHKVPMPF
uniref:Apelin n=1 Tax=Cynoglossus semilaevis TaxID=244447 RepID=A0A3P8UVQ3_CYNSE